MIEVEGQIMFIGLKKILESISRNKHNAIVENFQIDSVCAKMEAYSEKMTLYNAKVEEQEKSSDWVKEADVFACLKHDLEAKSTQNPSNQDRSVCKARVL